MDERIEYQLLHNRRVTFDMYYKLNGKNYSSGRLVRIGDIILYGFLMIKNEDDTKPLGKLFPRLGITLISFHIEELYTIYTIDKKTNTVAHNGRGYPTLKLIK